MKWFKTYIFIFLVTIFSALTAAAVEEVTMSVGQPYHITLQDALTNTAISDREIVKVVIHDDKSVSIIGKKPGRAHVSFSKKGKLLKKIQVEVVKTMSKTSLKKHRSSLKRLISNLFPHERIGVNYVGDSVALTGSISSNEVGKQIVSVVEEATGEKMKVINLLKLRSSEQVMLHVRVGELKRDELQKLGTGWQGVISLSPTIIGALQKDDVFKILAEPRLTAISGETANFLAGGEFPVPVRQGDNGVSVEYKPFGVNINFTPHVLSENRLRLNVSSEVSELSDAGAVKISSMNIPSVTTRKANTVVELAPGESFMIAGLIRDNYQSELNKVAGLGEIPVLSALFSSSAFQRNESELVIAVTPYLVDPIKDEEIRMPAEGLEPATALEMIFTGQLGSYNQNEHPPLPSGVEGPVGFVIE